ncbi:MAG: type II toxin-antitoxin system HicB family antitoxin [Patescibacteria group bacterium]
MKHITFRVIIEPDENNTFHSYVPALPGCHSWGDSLIMAKINIHEAIELYIEDLVSRGETVPDETSFDTFETVISPSQA